MSPIFDPHHNDLLLSIHLVSWQYEMNEYTVSLFKKETE